MPNFDEANWQVIISSLGISTALTTISGYLWLRFTQWNERNDLKSQKSRIDTIKELLELRNELSSKNKDEEILVHTILKIATTREILQLSRLINKKNFGILYYLKQVVIYITLWPLIIGFAFCSGYYILSGEIWIGIGALLGAVTLTPIAILAVSWGLPNRKESNRFIVNTIIGAESKEDVDAIIIKALQGEDVLATKKDS